MKEFTRRLEDSSEMYQAVCAAVTFENLYQWSTPVNVTEFSLQIGNYEILSLGY